MDRVSRLLRYWHTLRYLKPSQVFGRLAFRLKPRVPPPPAACTVHGGNDRWVLPPEKNRSLQAPETFCFLGQSRRVADRSGWNDPGVDKLWLYNLHYFDDLNAVDADQRTHWHQSLLARWINENPPGQGNGWEPYPVSLRIVNWIKWCHRGHVLSAPILISLAQQAAWLEKRLEWHLLGNHLFENAKALIFAGLFFDSRDAVRWRQKGLRILDRQLAEQILPDGGHFELSPMYHAIITEDLLDLINAAQLQPQAIPGGTVERWRLLASKMLCWQVAMTHPDGGPAFFNDTSLDIAPLTGACLDYAARLGIKTEETSEGMTVPRIADYSGYQRLDLDRAVAFLDTAAIGPDYLPGHAHADSLSFELSIERQRVIVNGGISCYGTGPERLRQRGTAAHSTVTVAGLDSSEVWSGFRVARRAYPQGLSIEQSPQSIRVCCAHDGYTRLPGGPVHARTWLAGPSRLTITDELDAAGYPALARFLLHPDVDIRAAGDGRWQLTLPGQQRVSIRTGTGQPARLVAAQYAPRFGQIDATHCLEVDLINGRSEVTLDWS